MTPREKSSLLIGLAFCLPWLIGMSGFLLYPLGAAFYYSLCDYSVLLDPVFIGLDNYSDLAKDELFWKSLGNTVYFALGAVLLGVLVALGLALLLNCQVRGLALYRTLFFLPSLMPLVATSILWTLMYNGQNGIINSGLRELGILGPAWLTDPAWAKPAMILMAAWGSGHAMVIFLAGLQDIPLHLYEAALIDGAGFFERLRFVTLPMLSPVIYFNVIMGIISGFQAFTQALIMTDSFGAPERSTLFYVLALYNSAFQDLRMGYASAMAFILFLIVLLLTVLATRISRRWVHYER